MDLSAENQKRPGREGENPDIKSIGQKLEKKSNSKWYLGENGY